MIAQGAAAITVTDLSKRFVGAPPTGVLDAVNLIARGGTLSLIVGAPCSGKSTLLRCLTGVYRPDAGEVTFRLGARVLNLTAADIVIHYDPWWNPAAEAQATDRAHRIGQQQPVFVYKLIAQGTVEEKIVQLQATKDALARQLFTDKNASPARLTAADLEVLLAP